MVSNDLQKCIFRVFDIMLFGTQVVIIHDFFLMMLFFRIMELTESFFQGLILSAHLRDNKGIYNVTTRKFSFLIVQTYHQNIILQFNLSGIFYIYFLERDSICCGFQYYFLVFNKIYALQYHYHSVLSDFHAFRFWERLGSFWQVSFYLIYQCWSLVTWIQDLGVGFTYRLMNTSKGISSEQ